MSIAVTKVVVCEAVNKDPLMFDANSITVLLSTLLYSFLGVVVFGLTFWLATKVIPFSVRKEIEEDENTALAIILGAVIIGLALIIASAISS